MRGLQRGAQSFTARTALAALEITTRIIHLLQVSLSKTLENFNTVSYRFLIQSLIRSQQKQLMIWCRQVHQFVVG